MQQKIVIQAGSSILFLMFISLDRDEGSALGTSKSVSFLRLVFLFFLVLLSVEFFFEG